MDAVLGHIRGLLNVSDESLVIVALLSLFAAYLVRVATDSRVIASVFLPGQIYGAFLSNYLMMSHGLFITSDKEAQACAAAGVGLILATFVQFLVLRTIGDLWGWHVSSQHAQLARPNLNRVGMTGVTRH